MAGGEPGKSEEPRRSVPSFRRFGKDPVLNVKAEMIPSSVLVQIYIPVQLSTGSRMSKSKRSPVNEFVRILPRCGPPLCW
jgi:hypothetical protein